MSWQTRYLQYIRGINNYYQGDAQKWTKIPRKPGIDLGANKYKRGTTVLADDFTSERARVDDETIEQLKRERIISEEV